MRIIAYLDYTTGNIVFHEVNVKELHDNYEEDIYAYADVYAPSNNFNWMEIPENGKLLGDEEIMDNIKNRIEIFKKNSIIEKSIFLALNKEKEIRFFSENGIAYEEWNNVDAMELRINLEFLDEQKVNLLMERYGFTKDDDLTYLIIY